MGDFFVWVTEFSPFTPAAEGHGLWPWMNASRQWTGDVAPLGREVGATGFARGAPPVVGRPFTFGFIMTSTPRKTYTGGIRVGRSCLRISGREKESANYSSIGNKILKVFHRVSLERHPKRRSGPIVLPIP